MIIGFGSIGNRHFQSLLKIKKKLNIYLIDPKFNRNKSDFLDLNSISSNAKIFTYSNLDIWLKKKIILDVCIIATNSDMRFDILKKIISSTKVKNIILEKFLFNKVSDYKKAQRLFFVNPIPIFVNQWMCQSLVIRNILSKFKNDKVDIDVTGHEWGMACNIVHFIDLIRYINLDNFSKPKILNFNLSKKIRPAKRQGFFEIYGDISINYGVHNLYVNCIEDAHDVGSSPFGIDIKIKSRNYPKKIINFNLKSGWVNGEETIEGNTFKFTNKIELISDMTQEIVQKLLINKKIYLPTLQQSINQHLVISVLFAEHFKKTINTKKGLCPVT